MRIIAASLFCICAHSCLATPAARAQQSNTDKSRSDELPRSWDISDIDKVALYGDGIVYVMSWQILQDSRPHRIERCLVMKKLTPYTEERWILAHLIRVPSDKIPTWSLYEIYPTPTPFARLGKEPMAPGVICYAVKINNRPRNVDVYNSLKDVDWDFTISNEWKIVAGAVCEKNWFAVTAEKPSMFFSK